MALAASADAICVYVDPGFPAGDRMTSLVCDMIGIGAGRSHMTPVRGGRAQDWSFIRRSPVAHEM